MKPNARCRFLRRLALLALLVHVPACSGNPEPTYPVQGTVRLDGKPLSRGTVLFEPTAAGPDGKVHSARGTIKPDGTYRLSTFGEYDGAVVGRHRAVVIVSSLVPPEGATEEPKPLIPARYSATGTSGLEYEVKPEANRIDIELSGR